MKQFSLVLVMSEWLGLSSVSVRFDSETKVYRFKWLDIMVYGVLLNLFILI